MAYLPLPPATITRGTYCGRRTKDLCEKTYSGVSFLRKIRQPMSGCRDLLHHHLCITRRVTFDVVVNATQVINRRTCPIYLNPSLLRLTTSSCATTLP